MTEFKQGDKVMSVYSANVFTVRYGPFHGRGNRIFQPCYLVSVTEEAAHFLYGEDELRRYVDPRVERVAQVLLDDDHQRLGAWDDEDRGDWSREVYRTLARKALEAADG